MSDDVILELANLFVNSAQIMFLAYLAAKFREGGPPANGGPKQEA